MIATTRKVQVSRLPATVLGVDIARNLVAAGNRRAGELELTSLRFQEGDASQLRDLADGTFEVAENNGRAADILTELEGLFASQNRSAEPNRTVIPATFLRVTVTV